MGFETWIPLCRANTSEYIRGDFLHQQVCEFPLDRETEAGGPRRAIGARKSSPIFRRLRSWADVVVYQDILCYLVSDLSWQVIEAYALRVWLARWTWRYCTLLVDIMVVLLL